uniref:Cation-transporting P-type ATPase C-terminal domain-containing protein n=1 Tax=Panagrolaimus sp. ES5 TaxID=591445 RepID=A0AC34F1D3_9BILA
MAKNNVLIKKPDIIDKLGSVTVMCIEKTGILTENQLEVNGIWSDKKDTEVKLLENKQKKVSVVTIDGFNNELKRSKPSPLLTAMTVCNNAQFDHINGFSTKVSTKQALKKWKKEHSGIKSLTKIFTVIDAKGHSNKLDPIDIAKLENGFITDVDEHTDADIIGGPVDVALLKYANKLSNIDDERNSFPKLIEIPFNPIRRWQLTISRCQQPPQGVDAELLPDEMGSDDVVNVEKWEEYGYHGYRVIGFAMKHFISKSCESFSVSSNNYPINELVFLGMASLIDPPKIEVTKAMEEIKAAGIKIVLVAGDPASSVLAVAKEIGLIPKEVVLNGKSEKHESSWTIINGDNISMYKDSDWDKVFHHQVILFAHVNPTQKLQIVQEAQKRKETVAYAGINTVAAIGTADVGIALSGSSTDLAQNVAGIILTDNCFASILKGIEQGRLMFDNLSLSIAFTLTHLLPEICPIMLTFIFEMPLALQPLQILLIDLITDFFSSISLVWENHPESDVMKLPPRNCNKRLVPASLLLYAYGFAGIAITIGCFAAYLSVFWYYGISLSDIVLTSEDFWDYKSENLTVSSSIIILTAAEQVHIRQQASAAWMGTLIFAQA